MTPTETERHVVRSIAIALVILAGAVGGPAVATAKTPAADQPGLAADGPGEESVPITVNTTYRGTSTERDHAVVLTTTVEPTAHVLRNTTLTVRPTARAFVDFDSVDTTVSTSGGEQVVESAEGSAGRYRISKLKPGESVTIQVRLYPESLVPRGEHLATVSARTRFASNERIVETSKRVTAGVPAGRVAVVERTARPQLLFVAGALLVGVALAWAGFWWWWRSRRSTLAALATEAADATTSRAAERPLETLLDRLGGQQTDCGDVSHDGTMPRSVGDPDEGGGSGTEEEAADITLTVDED